MDPPAETAPPPCCNEPDLRWRQLAVADRWSDVYACASCAHVHNMESWHAALSFPGDHGCVNCGGALIDARCIGRCGLDVGRARSLHQDLARLHPTGDFLEAASSALEAGRQVLALKLATAATQWGSADPVLARTIRLQALEGIGQRDRALDEAYSWARSGAPAVIWALIAELEGATGNVNGAIEALRQAVEREPTNLPMWAELAELLAHTDARGPALQAARRALSDSACQTTCLNVIAAVAGRYYEETLLPDASAAMQHARLLDRDHVGLAWLRARILEGEGRDDEATAWAERVLELKPDHPEARAMVKRLRPRRWLW